MANSKPFDFSATDAAASPRGANPICDHARCGNAANNLCLVGCGGPCPIHGTACREHVGDRDSYLCFAYCSGGAHAWDAREFRKTALSCGCSTCIAYLTARNEFQPQELRTIAARFTAVGSKVRHSPWGGA